MAAVGTTHHLKLGNEFLIVRPNSYTKRPAPTFGARITTGDPDYNNLSIWQHWVQKCWVGGIGADEWIDDAMFDWALGLDTTKHEQARLSRTLKRGSGAGWSLGSGTQDNAGYRFVVYEKKLFALAMSATGDSRLYRYDPTAQSWTTIAMPGSSFLARSIIVFDGKLYVGGISGTTPKLYWSTSADTSTTPTWNTITNPSGVTQAVYAMAVYNSKLYVAYGVRVWRQKTDQTWDGNAMFYQANASSSSNYISAMETHLGFLYMLSQNGHIHRTDGNNTFDIWAWDGQTAGVSLRSYDGKLFVGTYEYTDTTAYGDGVLYQFTGAAVTELKRWGKVGRNTNIGQMMRFGRRLYYGAPSMLGYGDGFGIATYDAIEDAHSIFATQDDTTTYADASGYGNAWLVDDLIVFGGKLFCAVRDHGAFFTEDSYNDVVQGRAQYTTSTAGGTLYSSLYDAGTPGLEKMWNQITVYCDLPAATTSFTLSYSINGGSTWTALTTQAGPSSASNRYIFNLQNIRSSRFKWKIVLKTTDETKSPTLRAVVVAYLPQPEPNWMWTFSVPVSDKWTLLDGTVETKTTNTLINYLENLYRSQQLVTFIDIDGVQWATNGPGVIVYDMTTVHYDVEAPNREGDVRITLLETVETY